MATIGPYRYLTFVTGGARPDDRLPMIVGLHYSSATPERVASDFDTIDVPARIVLPQGRHPRRDGFSWFSSTYANLDAAAQRAETFRVTDELSTFVTAVLNAHPTIGKPIVTGVSYGGDLSFLLALQHPAQFRAAFPVAARFLPDWMPARAACAPGCPLIFVMHGDKDQTVPMEPTRQASRQLAAMGFRVEFHAYAGIPHDFSAQMQQDFSAAVRTLLAPAATPAAPRP